MSDKLEALSQPIGLVTNQLDGAVIVESDQLLPGDNVYSQEYVTALLAALEEKDQRIAELEQRLQQPIKLPKREIGMACEFVSDHIVVSLAAVLVEAATAGFKAEVEGE